MVRRPLRAARVVAPVRGVRLPARARYGLGLAIGGTICAGWLVLTTATEQTERPIGLAVGNPDYSDLEPHIVTIVGVGLMLFFGLVATAMALIDDR